MVPGSSMVCGDAAKPGVFRTPLRSPCLTNRALLRKTRFGKVRRSAAMAFVGGLDPVESTGVIKIATMLATSASVAIGALLLGQQLMPEQDQLEHGEPCPSCGGTGYEPCICNRWSDGDVGCNGCGHTGFTKCKSCGGGGTAVPVPITIRKEPPHRMQ